MRISLGLSQPKLVRTGKVDRVYVKVDENAAYWVNGDQSGAVNLW